MDLKLQGKLYERFKFYRPYQPLTNSLMGFGFECGDGWYQLIWNLSEEIEDLLTKHNVSLDYFDVFQVKEKYGGLRFYCTLISDKEDIVIKLYNIIDKYEELSLKTCEVCGKEGKLQEDIYGWLKTICKICKVDKG